MGWQDIMNKSVRSAIIVNGCTCITVNSGEKFPTFSGEKFPTRVP